MPYLLTTGPGDPILLTQPEALLSAGLLSQLIETLQLPPVRESPTDAQLYTLLSNAQRKMITLLAVHVPQTQVAASELLTTTDSGETYTLTYYPLGQVEIRHGRAGPVLIPGADWNDWADFVIEGQTIRTPGGRTKTWANGLYARYVRAPDVISATVDPVIQPPYAGLAIVYEAAAEFAMQGGLRDPAPYQLLLQRFLLGDPNTPGHLGLIDSLKVQYFGQGGVTGDDSATWWRGLGQ